MEDFFDRGGVCGLPQFEDVADCETLYPSNESNSELALNRIVEFDRPRLNNTEVQQLVAFLDALSDPCVQDRECLDAWIPDNTSTGPDGQQLNGRNAQGDLL